MMKPWVLRQVGACWGVMWISVGKLLEFSSDTPSVPNGTKWKRVTSSNQSNIYFDD